MADKPIIFSGPMVRALLDGRKTQTRRILKPQPFPVGGQFYRPFPRTDPRQWHSVSAAGLTVNIQTVPYATGDRLWVREGFVLYHDLDDRDMRVGPLKTAYKADGGFRWLDADTDEFRDCPPWKPSIHMPRWASRLTLIVTDVLVQRLKDISRGDAMDEGCPFANMAVGSDPRDWFATLWNSIHGPEAWDANPWVCALTFTVHKCNIDSMVAAA